MPNNPERDQSTVIGQIGEQDPQPMIIRTPLSRGEFLMRTAIGAALLGIAAYAGVHVGTRDSVDSVDRATAEVGTKLDAATDHIDSAREDVKAAQGVCKKLDEYGPQLEQASSALKALAGITTTTTTAPPEPQPGG